MGYRSIILTSRLDWDINTTKALYTTPTEETKHNCSFRPYSHSCKHRKPPKRTSIDRGAEGADTTTPRRPPPCRTLRRSATAPKTLYRSAAAPKPTARWNENIESEQHNTLVFCKICYKIRKNTRKLNIIMGILYETSAAI
jgi:hypothetical protein